MILVLSTISETAGVGTYVELQWLLKTHHIQICDLLIEASDIKATSMVLNQFKVRKLNSGVIEFHDSVVGLISQQLYIGLLDYCILFT
jgi:hypothetical protein